MRNPVSLIGARRRVNQVNKARFQLKKFDFLAVNNQVSKSVSEKDSSINISMAAK